MHQRSVEVKNKSCSYYQILTVCYVNYFPNVTELGSIDDVAKVMLTGFGHYRKVIFVEYCEIKFELHWTFPNAYNKNKIFENTFIEFDIEARVPRIMRCITTSLMAALPSLGHYS